MTDEKLDVRYLPVNKLEWSIIRKTPRLQGLEHLFSWDDLIVPPPTEPGMYLLRPDGKWSPWTYGGEIKLRNWLRGRERLK